MFKMSKYYRMLLCFNMFKKNIIDEQNKNNLKIKMKNLALQ